MVPPWRSLPPSLFVSAWSRSKELTRRVLHCTYLNFVLQCNYVIERCRSTSSISKEKCPNLNVVMIISQCIFHSQWRNYIVIENHIPDIYYFHMPLINNEQKRSHHPTIAIWWTGPQTGLYTGGSSTRVVGTWIGSTFPTRTPLSTCWMADSGRALEDDDAGTVRSPWRFLLAGLEIVTLPVLGGLDVDDEGVDEDAVDNVGLCVAVTEAGAGLVSRKGSTVGWMEEAAISRVPNVFSLNCYLKKRFKNDVRNESTERTSLSAHGCTCSKCRLFRRRRAKRARATIMKKKTPPITPPTIAPIFFDLVVEPDWIRGSVARK